MRRGSSLGKRDKPVVRAETSRPWPVAVPQCQRTMLDPTATWGEETISNYNFLPHRSLIVQASRRGFRNISQTVKGKV